MWHTLPAGTALYRITRHVEPWENVLLGLGSFFGSKGRFSRAEQATVYSSPDPVVALSEFAWHAALRYTELLGRGADLTYPLLNMARLWRFRFDSPVTLVDATTQAAAHRFGHPIHAVVNPHPGEYESCQRLADSIREWVSPPHPHPRPEGLLAPSVRTRAQAGVRTTQVVLFVRPPGVMERTLAERAELLGQWEVELEFLSAEADSSISSRLEPLVAWMAPRYRLSGETSSVPRFSGPPSRRPIPCAEWQQLKLQYSS
jgi:hypothetical protein